MKPTQPFGASLILVAVLAVIGLSPIARAGDRAGAEAEKARGDQLLQQKNLEQALSAYRRAAELDPSWYVPHEAVGKALFSAGRHQEAAEAFKKAVEVNPGYFTGLYNIAYALRKAGQFQQAIEYYQKYLAKNPTDPDGYYGLAASYEAAAEYKSAVRYYQEYCERENRPSERPYVLKAKEKIEQLQKKLGVAASPPPPAATPAPPAAQATTVAPAAAPTTPPPPAPTPPPAAQATASAAAPAAAAPAVAAATPLVASSPAPSASTPAAGAVSTVQRPSLAPGAASAAGPEQAKQLVQQGAQALEKGSYALAMKAYFDALAIEPGNTEALFGLGRAYQLSGNNQAAALKWKKVLELDPNHQGARLALQQLQGAPPAAAESPPAQEPPTATTQPQKPPAAAATQPAADPELRKMLDQGDHFLNQKSFSRAIAAYNQATIMNPKSEEAWFKLGVAYALSGNYQAAIYKWQKVLEINPQNLSAQRNIEKARARLSAAATPAPTPETPPSAPPAAASSAAPLPAAPAQPAAARPAGRPALPADAVSRCQALLKEGRAQEALKQMDELVTNDQKNFAAQLCRGEALLALGRLVEARQAFTQALVAEPNRAAPLWGLGESYRRGGDREKALYYMRMYTQSAADDVEPARLKQAQEFIGR